MSLALEKRAMIKEELKLKTSEARGKALLNGALLCAVLAGKEPPDFSQERDKPLIQPGNKAP